ncbi:uncharacterized protein LOC127059359 [Serinus canaria]|uniref:uncharacterized protein LOC127059359 n=1 Tax=Serinus canaria TaxID=9135 RepID=UPI0021CCAD3B|nr:uncharacterized protein LOC127059359 [Serinus canaria]
MPSLRLPAAASLQGFCFPAETKFVLTQSLCHSPGFPASQCLLSFLGQPHPEVSHPHSLLPLHTPLGSSKRQVAERVGAFPHMVPCCFVVAMLAPLVLALEQSPHMVIKEGQSVNLECSKKKSSSTAMYWFILPSEKNSSLTLLASAVQGGTGVVEKGFESHFKSSNIQGDSITLSIEHAFLNDSGTYYCAEGEHSDETAEGAEHKLVPAQTGPALHLVADPSHDSVLHDTNPCTAQACKELQVVPTLQIPMLMSKHPRT